eukprot:6243997-Karenia_brevis.AAC.1
MAEEQKSGFGRLESLFLAQRGPIPAPACPRPVAPTVVGSDDAGGEPPGTTVTQLMHDNFVKTLGLNADLLTVSRARPPSEGMPLRA